jgi:DNA polymerase I
LAIGGNGIARAGTVARANSASADASKNFRMVHLFDTRAPLHAARLKPRRPFFVQSNLIAPTFVASFGFATAKALGFEADDFLAAAVATEERAGGTAVVASGDRDSFQRASLRTMILYPSRGGELARIGPKEVRQRYAVDRNQVPDFIALRGDPSDKLPGAAGVGPKRAAELLRRYGTLDGVLDTGLFQTQAEMLRLYRLIATMDAKAPLPSLADQEPTWAAASTFARSWGMKQLADRLAGNV